MQAPTDPVSGKSMIPDWREEKTFSDGFVNGPLLFNVGFHPRSQKHAAVIQSSFEEAQAVFESQGLAMDERR
jgi:hypothetical protein